MQWDHSLHGLRGDTSIRFSVFCSRFGRVPSGVPLIEINKSLCDWPALKFVLYGAFSKSHRCSAIESHRSENGVISPALDEVG